MHRPYLRLLSCLALIVCVVFGTILFAQSPAVIEGVVFEAGTDRALPGAGISLTEISEPEFQFGPLPTQGEPTVTDAQGRFRIESKAGRFRVIPTLAGFVYSRPNHQPAPREPGVWITATAGQSTGGIQLRMVREGVIRGRVLDANGQPTPSGSAYLSRYRYDAYGLRRLSGIPGVSYAGSAYSFVRTDDLGEFRLYGLQPGDYYVQVSAGAASAFFPGTTDESKASKIQVNPGEEVNLGTIILPPVPKRTPVRLRFKSDGRTLVEGEAEIRYGSTLTTALMRPGQDSMMLQLAPGRYDMAVKWNTANGDRAYLANAAVDVGDTEVEMEIAMTSGFRLSGSIALEDAGGRRPIERVQCRLRPESTSAFVNCFGTQTAPGFLRLEMPQLPADTYVLTATADGRDVLREGLQLQADTELNVVIAAPGGVIDGTVRTAGGDKLANAVVALVPDAPSRAAGPLYRSVISDQNGNFELRGVAPGAYQLFAWPELEGAAYRNAEFMKEFDDRGKAIRIEKGARVSSDITAF